MDLHPVDVDALRERWVMLDQRPECGNIDPGNVGRVNDGVGIPHRYESCLQFHCGSRRGGNRNQMLRIARPPADFLRIHRNLRQ